MTSITDCSDLLERMRDLNGLRGDTEGCHFEADKILCEALYRFEQADLVFEFLKMKKWYG